MIEFDNRSPEDIEYGLELPFHLAEAGKEEFVMLSELYELLTEFKFIENKISALTPQLMIDDYDLTEHFKIFISDIQLESLELIQGALRLAANILIKDKTQLAGQLLGRLLAYQHPGIEKILKQSRQNKDIPWLCPLVPSLVHPTNILLRSINGHTGALQSIIITPDIKRFISSAIDDEIKIWDIETGIKIGSLKGYIHPETGQPRAILALALVPRSNNIISVSNDSTIKGWDLSSGNNIFTLQGHNGEINAVVVTQDSRYIVSASDDDKTIKIWDLEQRKEIREHPLLADLQCVRK